MVEGPEYPRASASDLPQPLVAPDVYDDRYFREVCLGAEQWSASGGAEAAAIYGGVLQRAGLRAGDVLVDIGTGRGELLTVAVRRGAARAIGVEYAQAGVALARQTLSVQGVLGLADVLLADARALPIRDATVDLVTMIDVVEHLSPTELDLTLRESYRILRPGGRIVIHTFPTRTLYQWTYRLQRLVRPRRWKRWPADPRNEFERKMHVNEQTLRGLRRSLAAARFRHARVRPGKWVYTDFVPDERAKRAYTLISRVPGLARFGIADIWGEGHRPVTE